MALKSLAAAWMLLAAAALAQTHTVNSVCCAFVDSVTNTNVTNVTVGTTVVWLPGDAIPHTVTSGTAPTAPGAGSLFNGTVAPGMAPFTFTFNVPGTYPYFCTPHYLAGMVGTVNVAPPASVTSVGTGCLGSNGQVLTAGAVGLPQIGSQTFALTVSGGLASGTALLFGAIGGATPPIPVTPACNLYLEINSFLLFIQLGITPLPVPLSASGTGTFPFPVPASFTAGTRLDVQWAQQDAGAPGGFTSSNALTLIFGA